MVSPSSIAARSSLDAKYGPAAPAAQLIVFRQETNHSTGG
jgi:hypothetical protein